MSVSIVLTAYNRANQVYNTLKSIQMQDYKPIDIIVAEDGNDDRTQYIAKRNGASYVNRKRLDYPAFQNPARLHNLGIRAAKNDIIILQGGEVAYTQPTDVSRLVEPILKDPSVVTTPIVASLKANGDFDGWYVHPSEGNRAGWVVNFCLAMTRERLMYIQGFDEWYKDYGYEDDTLVYCLRENGAKIQYVPEVRVNHQWHDRSRYFDPSGGIPGTGESSPGYKYSVEFRRKVEAGEQPAIANYGKEWGRG